MLKTQLINKINIFVGVASLSLLGLFSNKALAVVTDEIQVICLDNNGPCSMSPAAGATLFYQTDWKPGDTVTKRIYVKNYDHNDECNLKLKTKNEIQTPSNFAGAQFTAIRRGSGAIYGNYDGSTSRAVSGKTLQNVFDASKISLGTIGDDGASALYYWTVTFDINAGNEFQKATMLFDFDLEFTCDHDDDDDDHDDHDDDDDDDDDNDNDTKIPSTPVYNSGYVGYYYNSGDVAGESTTSVTPVPTVKPTKRPSPTPRPTEPLPEVAGAGICTDPWWWWLVYAIQAVVMFAIYTLINKNSVNKRNIFYVIKILSAMVFGFIFWKWFCPWWDWIVSLLASAIVLFFIKQKFDNLAKNSKESNGPESAKELSEESDKKPTSGLYKKL